MAWRAVTHVIARQEDFSIWGKPDRELGKVLGEHT